MIGIYNKIEAALLQVDFFILNHWKVTYPHSTTAEPALKTTSIQGPPNY